MEEKIYGDEKTSKYIYQQFSKSKNIDKYYKKIYNNLYTKNYIGFESYQHMKDFMDIDIHQLYLRKFPNFISFVFSIVSIIFLILLIIFSFARFCYKDKVNDYSDDYCIIATKIVVIIINLDIWIGFFIYFLYAYFKIYKNDKFTILKNINSDDFIKDFIDEIYERYKYKNIILIEIILFPISLFLFILAWIVKPIHQFYTKSSNKADYKIDINNNQKTIAQLSISKI